MTTSGESWALFIDALLFEVERLVRELPDPEVWTKGKNGSPVTELDVRIDLAARRSFAKYFPGSTLLSEELGSMRSVGDDSRHRILGVLDPIDGTESLLKGADTWWVSCALFVDGMPSAGIIHQPLRAVTFDSRSVYLADAKRPKTVGVSPDHIEQASGLARVLEQRGFMPVSEPHAAQKVAAVLSGECSSAVYLPTRKSPTWRSWDLAAGVVLAREAGLILTTGSGAALAFDDLGDSREDPWICSSSAAEHEAIVSAMATL